MVPTSLRAAGYERLCKFVAFYIEFIQVVLRLQITSSAVPRSRTSTPSIATLMTCFKLLVKAYNTDDRATDMQAYTAASPLSDCHKS